MTQSKSTSKSILESVTWLRRYVVVRWHFTVFQKLGKVLRKLKGTYSDSNRLLSGQTHNLTYYQGIMKDRQLYWHWAMPPVALMVFVIGNGHRWDRINYSNIQVGDFDCQASLSHTGEIVILLHELNIIRSARARMPTYTPHVCLCTHINTYVNPPCHRFRACTLTYAHRCTQMPKLIHFSQAGLQ